MFCMQTAILDKTFNTTKVINSELHSKPLQIFTHTSPKKHSSSKTSQKAQIQSIKNPRGLFIKSYILRPLPNQELTRTQTAHEYVRPRPDRANQATQRPIPQKRHVNKKTSSLIPRCPRRSQKRPRPNNHPNRAFALDTALVRSLIRTRIHVELDLLLAHALCSSIIEIEIDHVFDMMYARTIFAPATLATLVNNSRNQILYHFIMRI
jgi:hypothetical protein